MKTYGAGTVLRIPNLKTRMQVNGQLRAADALSPGEKTPKGTMDRNLVSLQSLCGCCTGHTHTHTHTHTVAPDKTPVLTVHVVIDVSHYQANCTNPQTYGTIGLFGGSLKYYNIYIYVYYN